MSFTKEIATRDALMLIGLFRIHLEKSAFALYTKGKLTTGVTVEIAHADLSRAVCESIPCINPLIFFGLGEGDVEL